MNLYDETNFSDSALSALETLKENGVTVVARREHGDPAETFLEVAADVDADNIVMCGREPTPSGGRCSEA